MRDVLPTQEQSFAPGRASYKKSQSLSRTAFLWEPRPAANAEVLPAQKQKLRPEVGPPTEEPKASLAPLFFVGRHAPRRMRRFCQLKSKSFAPRSGLLQKSQSAARAASVGAATPRRKRWFCQLKKQKLRPEVGPPTEEPKRRPRCFCGSRDPAAKAMVLSAQKQKLRPEVGPPTEEPKRRRAASVGGAPRGECDVLPLKSKSFAPRSGLLQEEPTRQPHRFFVGGATRGECGGSTSSKQKLRPEVGPPTRRAKAPPAPLFCGSRDPRRMRCAASS